MVSFEHGWEGSCLFSDLHSPCARDVRAAALRTSYRTLHFAARRAALLGSFYWPLDILDSQRRSACSTSAYDGGGSTMLVHPRDRPLGYTALGPFGSPTRDALIGEFLFGLSAAPKIRGGRHAARGRSTEEARPCLSMRSGTRLYIMRTACISEVVRRDLGSLASICCLFRPAAS